MSTTQTLKSFVRGRRAVESSFVLSGRRRHTTWPRDWSSDVCSTDLMKFHLLCSWLCLRQRRCLGIRRLWVPRNCARRSEERRVGKEFSSGWSMYPEKQENGALAYRKTSAPARRALYQGRHYTIARVV